MIIELKHRKTLNEKKSVCDDVVKLGDIIADRIFDDCEKQNEKISKITHYPFVENKIKVMVNDVFDGISVLTVHYIMYIVNTLEEYNSLIRNENEEYVNSEADYNERYLKIVSAFVDGYESPDFMSNLLHEIEHLYQYDKGMGKKVDLYQLVKDNVTNKDDMTRLVARSLYYTFKHEQDAFTHEFYGFLKQEQPKGDFEQLLKYSQYNQINNILNQIKQNKNDITFRNAIKMFGMSIGDYNKRLHYSYQRLKKKLYNAYERFKDDFIFDWRIDLNRTLIFEKNVKIIPYLKWDYEGIYEY